MESSTPLEALFRIHSGNIVYNASICSKGKYTSTETCGPGGCNKLLKSGWIEEIQQEIVGAQMKKGLCEYKGWGARERACNTEFPSSF